MSTRRSARRLGVLSAVLMAGVLVVACGATGDEGSADEEEAPPSTVEAVSSSSFGTLEDVCGPGDASVEPSEQGLDNGKLNIGVATDRGAELRPGLNREVWDASVAFAEWCNAAGGVQGLRINLVELDGALFNVEAAMTTACTDVFAMVGGGFAQDNLEFSGLEASDFAMCDLIDIPAFAVSPEKASSERQVQPLPNPPDNSSYGWLVDYAEQYPDDANGITILYGDVPALVDTMEKYRTLADAAGIDVADTISYPAIGISDWTPYALQVVRSGARTAMFVGETSQAAGLLAKLEEQGFEGRALLEANMYDDALFSVGEEGPEGAVVRIGVVPFEEADDNPATARYLDLVGRTGPDARTGSLGVASMSAWLLFVTAANQCADETDSALTRACIIAEAAAVDDWTAGGLHLTADPAEGEDMVSGECTLLLEVNGGEFVRAFPTLGSDDDAGDGSHCRTGTLVDTGASD